MPKTGTPLTVGRISFGRIGQCPTHHVPLTCATCVGAQGGARATDAQKAAARVNGKKGGRPRKTGRGVVSARGA